MGKLQSLAMSYSLCWETCRYMSGYRQSWWYYPGSAASVAAIAALWHVKLCKSEEQLVKDSLCVWCLLGSRTCRDWGGSSLEVL